MTPLVLLKDLLIRQLEYVLFLLNVTSAWTDFTDSTWVDCFSVLQNIPSCMVSGSLRTL